MINNSREKREINIGMRAVRAGKKAVSRIKDFHLENVKVCVSATLVGLDLK